MSWCNCITLQQNWKTYLLYIDGLISQEIFNDHNRQKEKGRPVVSPKLHLNANRQPLRYGAEGLQRQDLVDAGEVLVGVHLPARLKDQVLQLGEALLLHKEFGINKGLVQKMKEKH